MQEIKHSHSFRTSSRSDRQRGLLLCRLLLILTPFLCGGFLWLLTGTSPLHLDAWNTTWNDEVGYNRVIRLLRTQFLPRGVYGFNEDAPAHLAYGPYNIFTYIPYCLLSFATGISSHNFIYWHNVILAVAACVLFVLLAQPTRSRSLWAALFLATYLVAGRYIWSGMSESSYNFYLIVFTALVIWYIKHPDASVRKRGLALFGMAGMTFFWNTMRPYYFPLLLIPLYFILRREAGFSGRRRLFLALMTVAAAAASVGLFLFFTNYNVARYFFDHTQTETLQLLLGSGSVSAMLRQILLANTDALRDIRDYLRDWRWAGIISLLYFAQSLLMLLALARSLFARDKKRDGRCAVLFLMLLAGFAVYEANVVLYSPVQLHRMMLAVTLSYGLLLICLGGWEKTADEIVLAVLMAMLFVHAPEPFSLPQENADTLSAADQAAAEQEFEEILPLEDNAWDNTIAKLPESSDLQWEFMLPTYTSLNTCKKNVLRTLLTEKSLQSKYVLLDDGSDLNELCLTNGYKVIWAGYHRILYQTR